MIKLLIVDDEDYIRQGIRYTIPWEDAGMEIIGEAANGAEALQLALRLKPDIILADIQMPVMTGLELAGELSTLMPEIKVILLTAYGSTENLTNAIHVKVSAFILKNADSEKILETVLGVKKDVELQQAASIKIEQLRNIYDDNRHLIKATLLSRFLLNQITFSHFKRKAEKLELDLEGNSFSIILIKCNCSNEKSVIGNFLHNFSSYCPFSFFIQDQLSVVILKTYEISFTHEDMDTILPGILPLVFGNCIVSMNHIQSFEDFPLVYSILRQALEDCFWNALLPYTFLTPTDSIIEKEDVNTYPLESELIAAIIEQNMTSIQLKTDDYYTFMEKHKISRHLLLGSVKRIVILISAISTEDIDLTKMIELIDEMETPKEIVDLVVSLAVPVSNSSLINSQIPIALQYIKEHFTEDLYLEDVSKAVFLSAGYLSRIFKGETGYSFKEYIHKLRIEKAQQLICQTNYKYYEIAEIVGYKNYKYFSAYFNKITGCSAKEYMAIHKKLP